MRKLLTRLGPAIPVIMGLVFGLLLVATPAEAARHPTAQSRIQHYLECLNWMFTDPAKHREFCAPWHYVEPPDNNHAPEGLPPPSQPMTPPSQPSCPTHEYTSSIPSVESGVLILVHGGGEWSKPDDGCEHHHPPKECGDVGFNQTPGAASSLLFVVTGCYEYPPRGCPSTWTGDTLAPSILLVGGTWGGCPEPGAWTAAPIEAPSLLI